ncbi:MAG: cysteine desulfurase [Candidatus Nomurabacteria bacterium]|jgi:cysteine desulfurase/selenocysteine lyase|nr:cysteine desulfurase [Candidatus Nomurabacteria bacterium]
MNRNDFPIFKNQPSLVYLDSANTTLKPQNVINAVQNYYENYSANIGRTTYDISEHATAAFNDARTKVARFIGAQPSEIIFSHSATHAINQAAFGIMHLLQPGDKILLTEFEHNSNVVAWQQVAKRTGAKIVWIDDNPNLSDVKIFTYSLVSNITGELFDYRSIVKNVHTQGGLVLVDATQAISRLPINVDQLGCDLLAFSSHKMYGPSGVGVLYARQETMGRLQPLVYGSQTFVSISRASTELLENYAKFEPGTPNIEGVIGLGAAIEYLNQVGMAKIQQHDEQLTTYALKTLQNAALNTTTRSSHIKKQVGVLPLPHPTIHPHDFAMLLNEANIAVRAGKACSDILMQKLELERGVVRISFGVYTTETDIDKFAAEYQEIIARFTNG